ncbi:MAG: hypothetical protein LBC19_16820 [Tannerella sp.]|jgi:hypothetical protein|nr:hypothetical protein [Tannerella sp.]
MNKKCIFMMMLLAPVLYACGSDSNVSPEEEEGRATGKLSVVATKAAGVQTYSEATVVLTEDDIESYNGRSGRIALKAALSCDDFFRRMGDNSRLSVYLGEERLFEALLGVEDPKVEYDEPVFMASCGGDPFTADKYYLYDAYPSMKVEHDPSWDRFIRYLSDAGKLTEAAEPSAPVVPEDPDMVITAVAADDVKSYNLSTTEIAFVGFTVDDLYERHVGFSSAVSFYLGEKLLYEANCVSPATAGKPYHDLTLTWFDDKFYLSDGYPQTENEEWKQIREENAQKRKTEWDIFLKYLRDAGKIVE